MFVYPVFCQSRSFISTISFSVEIIIAGYFVAFILGYLHQSKWVRWQASSQHCQQTPLR